MLNGAVVLLGLLGVGPAPAADAPGRFVLVKGSVEVRLATGRIIPITDACDFMLMRLSTNNRDVTLTQRNTAVCSVDLDQEVSTHKSSAARIALGRPPVSGTVTLGPESRFSLWGAVLNPDHVKIRLTAGQLHLAFVPELKDDRVGALLGVAAHQVLIDTPNAHLEVYGSDLFVWFDAATGTTGVYVREGGAEVTGSEVRVSVDAGRWTEVPADGPPSPPVPLDPRLPGPLTRPDDLLVDPLLDLNDPRLGLDLPR